MKAYCNEKYSPLTVICNKPNKSAPRCFSQKQSCYIWSYIDWIRCCKHKIYWITGLVGTPNNNSPIWWKFDGHIEKADQIVPQELILSFFCIRCNRIQERIQRCNVIWHLPLLFQQYGFLIPEGFQTKAADSWYFCLQRNICKATGKLKLCFSLSQFNKWQFFLQSPWVSPVWEHVS